MLVAVHKAIAELIARSLISAQLELMEAPAQMVVL